MMNQTIKDKIRTQVEIHQNLLDYDDSDDSDYASEEEQKQVIDLPRSMKITSSLKKSHVPSDDEQEVTQHDKMIKRRRKVLEQLSIESMKENVNDASLIKYSSEEPRQLKIRKSSNNIQTDANTNQVLELKSKLAQILKQSHQQSSKITELQSTIHQLTAKEFNQTNLNNQIQSTLQQKDNQLFALAQENNHLTEKYKTYANKLESEYRNRTESLNQEIGELTQIIADKDKQIDLLTGLVKLKDGQIGQLKKVENKVEKLVRNNLKLKNDTKRLLVVLQANVKPENLTQSVKNVLKCRETSQQKPSKHSHSKSKSIGIQNAFFNTKNKKSTSFKNNSQSIDAKYLSLPSKIIKCESQASEWFPTDLIKKVQLFLKRWKMAQNNAKLVNSLVEFIHSYTEKCVNQNKSRMENQYKSLKKEIQRKANQSLNFAEIMKQRKMKIKLNHSQRNQSFDEAVKIYQIQAKLENLNLTSQNVSILVPASNKNGFEQTKHNLVICSQLNEKNCHRDDLGYQNLEHSIRLHNKNSSHHLNKQIPSQSGVKCVQVVRKSSKSTKSQQKKYKTQVSVNSSKISQRKSSSKKRSISQKKNYDYPLKKYKIY